MDAPPLAYTYVHYPISCGTTWYVCLILCFFAEIHFIFFTVFSYFFRWFFSSSQYWLILSFERKYDWSRILWDWARETHKSTFFHLYSPEGLQTWREILKSLGWLYCYCCSGPPTGDQLFGPAGLTLRSRPKAASRGPFGPSIIIVYRNHWQNHISLITTFTDLKVQPGEKS